ncbi:MAG: hypothetical protein MSA90_08575 [Faecalicatena sp.]|uniref:hypothetical protein n=1 Tax=Faecalicatena sp. TaxID=2005360 RepID=UPI00258F13E8|nr:hypothetical protein [Faecalicatena sp.]MCI6465510.1 hypothetical protein [Faecalicatena sp.]MDY5617342.1 hypothetical protein [Lachnospiraceae bacterium]
MSKVTGKNAYALIHNNGLNLLWLILMLTSASFGIVSLVIMILAVGDVQILSWSIGYILTSGTNDVVRTPSIVITVICAVVFVLCICKNKIIRAVVKD